MSIVFRPMTREDYINSGGRILRGVNKSSYEYLADGLNSKRIFGDFDYINNEEQNCHRENIRGYIQLTKPVINYILARDNAKLLGKILGMPGDLCKRILSFETVWDKSIEEYVNPVDILDPSDMLCHAEIFEMLIGNFNFLDATLQEFKTIIGNKFLKKEYVDEDDWCEITRGKGDHELLGDYYFTPNSGFFKLLKKGRDVDEITSYIQQEFINTGEERIAYLLNSSKDKLYGMLFNEITVLPPGMRPDIDNRHDQFTMQYATIIAANDALHVTRQGGFTVKEIIQRYDNLNKHVSHLVYKSDPLKKNTFSALQKLASKKGFIRGKMLSKRQDYSGRSVIIVNPKLSINECALPKEMIPKLYRHHHIKASPAGSSAKILSDTTENNMASIRKLGLLKKIPVGLNRQPSLHRLSYLAFYPRESESKAIELNPLVTTGYNADFDGDTMAAHVPIGDQAIQEAIDLMLPTRNLFVPASGKCTLIPRQEIIYGLNVATDSKYKLGTPKKTYSTLEEAFLAVMTHKSKVYDTITVADRGTDLAGKFAMMYCVPASMHKGIKEVTKSSINWYVDSLILLGEGAFRESIDKMVLLGFRMAQLYAPTISILNDIDNEFLKDPFKEFHEVMEQAIRLYDNGFEEESAFNSKFNQELSKVEKKVEELIAEGLGEDNGFLKLVNSGARGTVSNLIQIYAYKGRIARSANEAFNAVIENNFSTGLTPLEHFISAYGTRKGLIDKVNKTADTGYQMRLMVHTAADAIVRKEDCGTIKGLNISKAELTNFVRIETDDPSEKDKAVTDVFIDMIVGRYEAGTNKYITEQEAKKIANSGNKANVTIRSPLTCEEQHCAKCYGVDLSIRGDVVIGTAIGIMAAQSIGEPGTQLTMRTFQKGGVAGKGDVTSDFDRIQAFTEMRQLRGKFSSYDPIAWAVGKVSTIPKGLNEKSVKIGNHNKTVVVDAHAEIKEEIKEIGEGLCVQQGDHDPNEILEYLGIEAAQKYLLFILYHTYIGKASINLKHFEVLVASMTMHAVVKTDRKDLKVGQFYTTQQLYKGSMLNTKVVSKLRGVKKIPLLKPNALSNIMMENIVSGLSRAVAMGNEDDLEGILQRAMLGLKPKVGTYYKGYAETRLENERCRV